VEWLFLISGGLTAAYMTKLFAAIFLERRAEKQKFNAREYMAPATQVTVGLTAFLLLALGLTPWASMQTIAESSSIFLRAGEHHGRIQYFSWINLQGALISLAIGAAIYVLLVRTVFRKNENFGVYARKPKRFLIGETFAFDLTLAGVGLIGALTYIIFQ